MNGDGESSTAINAADNKVMGAVALGGGPEFTIADGTGNVFVNLEDKSELLRIDARTLQVKNRWPVAPCEAPSSMAFDAVNSRLFLGCRSKVMAVVDSGTGKVVTSYPIGDKRTLRFSIRTPKLPSRPPAMATFTASARIQGIRTPRYR